MIVLGMDAGARNIKVVVMKDRQVIVKNTIPSGFDTRITSEQILEKTLKDANITRNDVKDIILTGTGVDVISFGTSKISMVGALARAGTHFFPKARTIIDVGAEDARAVKCDEKGNMQDFVVNDRCAAGAGSFIEAMSRSLEVKIEEMGPLSLKAERAIPMNAQCVVFGESEVVSLIHEKTPKTDIARAIYDAMADRVSSMLHRLGINMDVVLVGGVAKDAGFIDSLKRKLRIDTLYIPEEPEYAGAFGAALSACKE